MAWSPDFKQLVTGSLDKNIKVWDATSGALVKECKGFDEKTSPKGHRDGVFTVAFTPDGKQIVSGSSDRTIKVWNVADGAMVREFVNPNLPSVPPQAHPGWIYHLRFTPDGQHIVSVGGAPRTRATSPSGTSPTGNCFTERNCPWGRSITSHSRPTA